MFDSILLLVEYGGYLSITKMVIFLAFFFPSWLLIQWMHRDAETVGANATLWVSVVLGLVVVMTLIWFFVPWYIVGALCYGVGLMGASLAYVKDRNARVLDFDRILTVAHIKSLVNTSAEEVEGMDSFLFITANKNDVPRPEARTPDFFGYRVAYDILTEAISKRAEFITLAPSGENYKVAFQIDGASVSQAEQQKDQIDFFLRFAKHLGGLDVKERRKPQKGIFYTRRGKDTIDWEIKTAGSTAGEQVRIRKVSQEAIIRVSDLGLTSKQVQAFEEVKTVKEGIVLVTGPKASGVTSTFYSILREHDAYTNNIYTFEKEITSSLPSVTQDVFKLSDTASTSYAKKLQQLFRMGADIVGVAECADSDTAQVICSAAQDGGKLIYVVVQADSVIQALGRWLKLVGDRKVAMAHLNGITNQRLLRQLCGECKQGYTPNQDILKKFNLPADKVKVLYRPGKVVYDKRGKESTCPQCFATGFVGRTGVFEMITFNDELKRVVLKSKTLQDMGNQFRRAKMALLQEQALRKVMGGVTAINEMVRVLTPATKKKAAKPSTK
ncbi:MAG: Flp pilus assembly complex ATPase component TadA [Phycisphaeraceae bacterium]|nr:Flp pilus assembly complex ATPase component TadA [Phycisphaeraceae bacterium]